MQVWLEENTFYGARSICEQEHGGDLVSLHNEVDEVLCRIQTLRSKLLDVVMHGRCLFSERD